MATKYTYDYIAARDYAIKNGKQLKDLTKDEMEMFKVKARSINLNEFIERLEKRGKNN